MSPSGVETAAALPCCSSLYRRCRQRPGGPSDAPAPRPEPHAGRLGGAWALALEGVVTLWLLLALVCAVSTGQAFTSPQQHGRRSPELVAPDERQQAVSLGAVNMNLAERSARPSAASCSVATIACTLFLVNAATFRFEQFDLLHHDAVACWAAPLSFDVPPASGK